MLASSYRAAQIFQTKLSYIVSSNLLSNLIQSTFVKFFAKLIYVNFTLIDNVAILKYDPKSLGLGFFSLEKILLFMT